MIAPRATMRLQFHRGFTFAQAAALAPYFASLGVSHLYASPIMTARPGSLHGYDTIDATQVNPELGGEAEFRRLVGELRRHELGLIVDIVPNHMAIGNGNAWWMDVLAHGSDSHYAKYFDIDWTPTAPRLRGKILLPILGRPYGEALAAGEITLQLSAARRPVVRYFDHELPLAAAAAGAVDAGSLAEFATASPDGRERLHRLLEQQHYRLAWWRCANDEINWRRFFDINDLAAIRVEDDEVFEAVHATLLRLYAEGLVDGVRVDHIDGLARPGEYCRRLRARLRALEDNRPPGCPAGPAYLVVEKILGRDEQLPVSWETDGTTGYDFMDEISALQHDGAGEQPLSDLWTQVSGRAAHFRSEEIKARREILQRSFSSQLEATLDALVEITQGDLAMRDISRSALRRCLSEILVHFPVYRIYAEVGRSSAADRAILSRAVSRAAKSCLPGDRWLVELLGNWLIGRPIRPAADSLQTIALTRFQQLSAPLSAKAVEDTAFYRYGRLLSRNDVGFDPSRFASSAEEFHARMQARGSTFPRALLATATHDHKRGEDVRARLAVLSEIADEWSAALRRWLAAGGDRPGGGAAPLPDAGDRAVLLQTLVGAWPLDLETADADGMKTFAARIVAWQQKALREAKLRSDWSAPDEAYERLTAEFVTRLLAEPSAQLAEIAQFARRIAPPGAVNGLGQALTKLTAPGVADIYQGTEYWDFSLVDPDNRAAVDFAARQRSLSAAPLAALVDAWPDGRIKQFLIARVLAVRQKMPELFAGGEYLPLAIEGARCGHIVAFARILADSISITVLCRHPARLLRGEWTVGMANTSWQDTRVVLPSAIRPAGFLDALTGNQISSADGCVQIARVLSILPVALLTMLRP